MGDIEKVFNINYQELIVNIFIIIFAIVAGVTILDKFFKIIGRPIKWFKGKDADHDLLNKTIKNVDTLQVAIEDSMELIKENQDEIRRFYENRVSDRVQSKEIQKEWTKKIDDIFTILDEMQKNTNERFAQSEAKTNKRVQSDIKERIAQSYRRYCVSKKISYMELEALEDLIDTYESFGGENSFVHSVVQKEMYTWEVVE